MNKILSNIMLKYNDVLVLYVKLNKNNLIRKILTSNKTQFIIRFKLYIDFYQK